MMVSCLLPATKVGNNVSLLEQNPRYKQKSRSVNVNKKRKVVRASVQYLVLYYTNTCLSIIRAPAPHHYPG